MPLTSEQKREAALLRGQGLGGRLIARALGVPYGRVRRWLEKAGDSISASDAFAEAVKENERFYREHPSFAETGGPATWGQQVRDFIDSPPSERLIGLASPGPLFRAVTFDLECTNLKSDLGTLVCAAFHDMHTRATRSRTIDDFGAMRHGEEHLALWIAQEITAADLIIGFNSQAFDHHYVNGVLTRYGHAPIPKRLIIDLYQSARYGWTGLPSSYSLRNLSHFFGLEAEKQSMDKDVWRQALTDPQALEALRRHCERDAEITALLWERLKQFHFDWRGR